MHTITTYTASSFCWWVVDGHTHIMDAFAAVACLISVIVGTSPSRRSPSWFSFIWAGRRISIHSREEYQPSCNKKTAIVWPEQHHVRRQEQGAWSCENDLTISSVDVVTNHYCHICSSALGYINRVFCQKAHFCICKCLTAWLTAFPGDP